MRKMTEEIAREIYDLLVMCGGASKDNRDDFVWAHIKDDFPCEEYRFQGHFGFGGKFYSGSSDLQPWRIGYHEDDVKDNPKLYRSLCNAINIILAALWEGHRADETQVEQ